MSSSYCPAFFRSGLSNRVFAWFSCYIFFCLYLSFPSLYFLLCPQGSSWVWLPSSSRITSSSTSQVRGSLVSPFLVSHPPFRRFSLTCFASWSFSLSSLSSPLSICLFSFLRSVRHPWHLLCRDHGDLDWLLSLSACNAAWRSRHCWVRWKLDSFIINLYLDHHFLVNFPMADHCGCSAGGDWIDDL